MAPCPRPRWLTIGRPLAAPTLSAGQRCRGKRGENPGASGSLPSGPTIFRLRAAPRVSARGECALKGADALRSRWAAEARPVPLTRASGHPSFAGDSEIRSAPLPPFNESRKGQFTWKVMHLPAKQVIGRATTPSNTAPLALVAILIQSKGQWLLVSKEERTCHHGDPHRATHGDQANRTLSATSAGGKGSATPRWCPEVAPPGGGR